MRYQVYVTFDVDPEYAETLYDERDSVFDAIRSAQRAWKNYELFLDGIVAYVQVLDTETGAVMFERNNISRYFDPELFSLDPDQYIEVRHFL